MPGCGPIEHKSSRKIDPKMIKSIYFGNEFLFNMRLSAFCVYFLLWLTTDKHKKDPPNLVRSEKCEFMDTYDDYRHDQLIDFLYYIRKKTAR
jgi:hypothetical protein